MADKRISQLIERTDIANNDVLPIVASGATTTNKVTISTIQDWMQENLDVGVTSVGLSMPSAFTVSNSPVTTSGNISVTGAGTVAQYIRGDGSLADFPSSTGGGSSVSYYLNGSVNQGTIGGIAYRELSKSPIFGAGTDFTINADGYIASFITDAGDPNLLLIPAGNWNFETYLQASSGGGSPTFYIELYKVSGSTATLIASNSGSPELIAFGTNINPYFSALAVPETTLALTDRLAIRYYVAHSGRTITLHTENNTLCQIITTFTTGLTALNGLTAQVQNFATGTSGTDFNISSASTTHTFNIPSASTTARGLITTGSQTIGGSKTFQNHVLANDFFYIREQIATTLLANYTQIYANSTHFGFNNGAGTASAVFTYNGIANYTLPSTSGTLALTSNLASYVPYTGATGAVDLGTHSLSANNLTANGGTNAGRLELKNANNASLIRTGYFVLSPSSNNTTIQFGFSTGASTWKNFGFSSHLIPDNTITLFALPSGGGTLAVTSDLGAYLPLSGGTLTGALNGTSGTFTGAVISTAVSVSANTGIAGDFTNNSSTNETLRARNNGSGNIAAFRNLSGQVASITNSGGLTLSGALNGTSAVFSGALTTSGDLFISGASKSIVFNSATNFFTQIYETSGSLVLQTGNNPRLTIASTGAATFSSSVGIGISPSYRLHVVTDAVAGKQNMSNISRTTGNWVRFTNPQFSTDSSMGLILKSFPDSDGRQGAGIIASGGQNNATTDLDLFVTNSPDGTGGTSYSALKINGFNGNVGIGTANPNSRLEVVNSGNAIITVRQSLAAANDRFSQIVLAHGSTFFGASDKTYQLISNGLASGEADFAVQYWNGSTYAERMRITSGGNVLIANAGQTDGALIVGRNGNNNSILAVSDANNTSEAYFRGYSTSVSASRIVIFSNGNIVNSNNSYGALSDIKIKENITDATPKLEDLLKVKVRNYNLIGEETKQIGVIAQELEEIFPAMIDESEDFEEVQVPQLDEEGNEVLNEEGEVVTTKERVSKGTTTKSVKYSVFVPMLIKAIQEQQEIINEMRAEIDLLKTK